MRIYLASNFASQARIRTVRNDLRALGHTITSSWLAERGAQSFELRPENGERYATRDLGEIVTSDLLIIDTHEQSNTGGREVEYGAALALGKPVWIVGPSRNVFHTVARRSFDSWAECYDALRHDGAGRSDGGLHADAAVSDQGRR
jgi:nucleoside 2-deoxyribosyltransferase